MRMNSKNQFHLSSDSTCIASQYSSPSTSRQLLTQLSFANLNNNKKVHFHNCNKTITRSPLVSKKQTNQNSSRDYRKTNQVAEAYEIENKSLKGTVEILKEQIQALNVGYRMLKEKNKQLKKQKEEQEKKNEKKLQKYEEYKRKSLQYDELVPKIQELEILQDRVLEQNSELKEKETSVKNAMGRVLQLIGNSQNETLLSIKKTIKKVCTNDN